MTIQFVAMSLRSRLILISVIAVAITAGACILLQRSYLHKQTVELTAREMKAVLLSGENVIQQSTTGGGDGAKANPMSANYFASKLNQMVPVVAAWRAIDGVARQNGMQFHIAARQPRNREHEATDAEGAILAAFEAGADEYQVLDDQTNTVVYARPVRLHADCLGCHGELKKGPAQKAHGGGPAYAAFILRSNLERSAPALQASMNRTMLFVLPIAMTNAVSFWVAGLPWMVGAVGMGLAFGAIGTLTLELSTPEDQGANSAALQVLDSTGSIVFIGIADRKSTRLNSSH